MKTRGIWTAKINSNQHQAQSQWFWLFLFGFRRVEGVGASEQKWNTALFRWLTVISLWNGYWTIHIYALIYVCVLYVGKTFPWNSVVWRMWSPKHNLIHRWSLHSVTTLIQVRWRWNAWFRKKHLTVNLSPFPVLGVFLFWSPGKCYFQHVRFSLNQDLKNKPKKLTFSSFFHNFL